MSLCALSFRLVFSAPQRQRSRYDSVGVFSSPRALFTFRAFGHHKSSIINGGLPQWQAEGHTVTRGTPEPIVSADPYPLPSLTADTIQSMPFEFCLKI